MKKWHIWAMAAAALAIAVKLWAAARKNREPEVFVSYRWIDRAVMDAANDKGCGVGSVKRTRKR